jgi:hypothetical protein
LIPLLAGRFPMAATAGTSAPAVVGPRSQYGMSVRGRGATVPRCFARPRPIVVLTNGEYIVKRDIPNWEPCADGSGRTATGHQRCRFFPVDETGAILPGSRIFAGFDKTWGESGGCSLNQKLEIDTPFRLETLA